MSYQLVSSRVSCAAGGALANLTAQGGRAVVPDTVLFTGACLWDGTVTPGTEATRPLGVITTAEDAVGGRCSVCVFGHCDGIVGAAGLAAGTNMITADATGNIVAFGIPAAGVNEWCLGFLDAELGNAAVAAGAKVRIFVNPQLVQG